MGSRPHRQVPLRCRRGSVFLPQQREQDAGLSSEVRTGPPPRCLSLGAGGSATLRVSMETRLPPLWPLTHVVLAAQPHTLSEKAGDGRTGCRTPTFRAPWHVASLRLRGLDV